MNLIEITSLEQPGPRRFYRIPDTQLRRGSDGGSFIAESPNVVLRALEAGMKPLSILCEKSFADAAMRGGEDSPAGEIFRRIGDIPIYVGSPELLSSITGYSLLRGISCEFRRPAPRTAAEICGITDSAPAGPNAHPGAAPSATPAAHPGATAELPGAPAAPTTSSAHRIAVIHGVVDAANIGAIFRSAAALGIDAILLSPDSCDPLNRRTVRTSMGTVFQIPWAILDGPDTIVQLHRLGFKTAAMALRDGALPPDSPELQAQDHLAIILGNEGNGLPQPLIDASDYVVCIPMSHGVDSLNVAIAGAIAFYVLR